MLRRFFFVLLAISFFWFVKCQMKESPVTVNPLHEYTTRNDTLGFRQKIWKNCTDNLIISEDLMSNHFDGEYLLKNCKACKTKKNLKLMIFVISAPGNIYQRNAIRMSWGHYSLRQDTSISFVIAVERWELKNQTHSSILTEISSYNDIIIPQYADRYDKLTLKTIFILDWARSCCSHMDDLYILKTDDDMIINVPLLLKVIKGIEAEDKVQRKIYGDIHGLNYPYRDQNEKYTVTCDQYPYLMYPNFTSGPAYMFSLALVNTLLSTALKTPYLKLEDVFLTGIVAETLGVPRVHMSSFINQVNRDLITNCKINKIVTLMIESLTQDQFVAWSLCNIIN